MTKSCFSHSLIEKLKLLSRRNLYETVVNGVNHDRNVEWMFLLNGPCGVLLRHNIMKEWWYDNVTCSDEAVFGIGRTNDAEGTPIKSETDPFDHLSSATKSIVSDYPSILKAVNGKLPFGLARCENSNSDQQNPDPDAPIRFSRGKTNLLLHFYVAPRTACHWFNQLQRRRLGWWKKFAREPSSFTMSNIRSDNETQTVDIRYKFPWDEEGTVETINSCGRFNSHEEPFHQPLKEKDVSQELCLIECKSSVEEGLLSLLFDGFREKPTSDGSSRIVLCLHNRLAPFKVAVARSSDLESNVQLKDLSSFIISDLRHHDISVFDWSNTKSDLSLEQQFHKYDEMGIPYCIVLNVAALKNGIVGLRSRDTTIQEQIHISEMNEKLLNYVRSY